MGGGTICFKKKGRLFGYAGIPIHRKKSLVGLHQEVAGEEGEVW